MFDRPALVNFTAAVVRKISDLILPCRCLHCETAFQRIDSDDTPFFCAPCWGWMHRLDGPACPVCRAPFGSKEALSFSPDHRCGACRRHPPAFSRAITPFPYEGALATAICAFKYQKKNTLAASLARLLHDDLRPLPIDCVIAIPLHPRRLKFREFNQSLLLAREVARYKKCHFFVDVMRKVKETPPQVGLSRKDREANVKRAFQVVHPERILCQRILLVDDVYTTGATLREGAKVLMKAGAKEVIVTTLARMLER